MYKVNLLPSRLQREGIIDVRRLVIIAGTTLLITAIIGSYNIFLIKFLTLKNELLATRQQLKSLTPIACRVEKIKKERKELEAALGEYSVLLKNQITWSDLLFELSNITPVDLWLVNMDLYYKEQEDQNDSSKAQNERVHRPNMVVFKGFSRTVPSIGIFINNLNQLPYFKKVRLNKINAENEGIKFEITATIKGDI